MHLRKILIPIVALSVVLVPLAFFAARSDNAGGTAHPSHKTPSRIVSLVPSNTEILFALGLGDKVVGVTKYCDYPPAAKKKPKVGDMNASAEKVVSLKPDLVLAHSFLNDNLTKRLKTLGIRVVGIDPKTFAELYRDMRRIGEITGTKPQADSIVRRMEKTVSDVRAKTAGSKSRKVLVMIQPNPLWAAGPKTFVDEMLSYSHASNAAYDARPGFNLFSTEVAVSRNPDVIVVTRKQEKDFVTGSPLWKQTNAVKHKAVYIVDGDLLLRPGPRLSQGLLKLAEAVHPEAFR